MSKPRRTGGSWRDRQERDIYVQMARRDGWRSRAVYKLEQIDQKERFLRPDMVCVDVGSALCVGVGSALGFAALSEFAVRRELENYREVERQLDELAARSLSQRTGS